MNERQYDRLNNEGAEGYNPYRAARERREIEAAVAWGKTRAGRKDAIYRALERKDCSLARECGTYNQAEIDALTAELRTIEATEEAEFLAAWPIDVTKERRAAWNARVKNGEFGNLDRQPSDTIRRINRAQTAQGWSLIELRKAVKLHNL